MNKVILLGRLTRDPEIRYTQGSEPMEIARYTLAVNKRFKREGEPDADFINCVVFGKGAEFAGKYFRKGQQVCVCGRLSIRQYEKDGQKHWMTEVILDEQNFADSKGASPQATGSYQSAPTAGKPNEQKEEFFAIDESLDDEDLPF